MCFVDCTSSISCLPSVHVCVCLFLPPLTMTTSLFVELIVTLSLLVSLCTICNACCRSSGWYEIRAISSATVGHPMNVVPIYPFEENMDVLNFFLCVYYYCHSHCKIWIKGHLTLPLMGHVLTNVWKIYENDVLLNLT
jgi:hypothetical protein